MILSNRIKVFGIRSDHIEDRWLSSAECLSRYVSKPAGRQRCFSYLVGFDTAPAVGAGVRPKNTGYSTNGLTQIRKHIPAVVIVPHGGAIEIFEIG